MYRMILILVMLIVLPGVGTTAELPTGPVPGKYIVKLAPHVNIALLTQSLGKEIRLQKVAPVKVSTNLVAGEQWERIFTIESESQSLSERDIITMLGKGNIEYIEPDYFLEFFDFPNDALFHHQWYLYNNGQFYYSIKRYPGYNNDVLGGYAGTPGVDIGLSDYYQNTPTEHTRVVVAIVDSGIDFIHPELQGRFWKNHDEIPGNGIDDDHNGLVDDTAGYDVSGDVVNFFNPEGDNDPTDNFGHGTHIAGIIGADANDSGVVGIVPWVELMPVKIMPNAISSVGAAGIVYAVNEGAQVINISWGTPFESSILKDAVDFARRNNVLVCIAPGNTGDNTRFYPAAFDSTFVVGAGNSDGYMAYFSTFGSHIDIIAPGLDILSLRATGTDMYADPRIQEPGVRIIDSLYYLSDGTSMATPMVAGAAALLLSLRPDLTRAEVEDLLLRGATDVIDPFNDGDSLVGPDTITGYGYLNIGASLALLQEGSVYIAEPRHRSRFTGDIPIKIASIAGYTGGWELEYSVGLGSENWQLLASGGVVPPDSLIYVFSDLTVDGFINFRLTDDFGSSSIISVIYSRSNKLEITSPANGAELEYHIPIFGSAYGPDYDSVAVFVHEPTGAVRWIASSTGEYFDSLLFDWSVSGSDTGDFDIYVYGYFQTGVRVDSVAIHVNSAFANGWPKSIGGRGAITAITCDLNHDGHKEIALGTTQGLLLFNAEDGSLLPGFPVYSDKDMRCVPAVYDVDGDGYDEIIVTNTDGIHVLNYNGTPAISDDLLECYTGQIPYEYAYPNPTITRLRYDSEPGATPDSAIMIINKLGQILAYRMNGDPYFYGLAGLFSQFSDRISFSYGMGGGTSPFVTAANLDGDGLIEVVASYTSPYPYTGVGIFNGANGEPAFSMPEPTVVRSSYVYGTALADLDGDNLPEIITVGNDDMGLTKIWVKTHGVNDFPGWPINVSGILSWIGSYPVVADLDLDGSPEILCTFFEYDIASLYIFKADGTPYITREGRPAGEAFSAPVTFGTPGVANLVGDNYPEIIFRSGYLLPGTGPERIYILDHTAVPIPGWPKATPSRPYKVFSSRYAPLVDDIDNDGKVELVMVSDGIELLVWDFEASVEEGRNTFRFLGDNYNSGIIPTFSSPVDVGDGSHVLLPRDITLKQNYPNPFNPMTKITFSLPVKQHVRIDVYNILGQLVETVVDKEMDAGNHTILFDGSPFATGVYMYRLQAGETAITRKMLLIK